MERFPWVLLVGGELAQDLLVLTALEPWFQRAKGADRKGGGCEKGSKEGGESWGGKKEGKREE